MFKNEYKQAKAKCELYKSIMCISNALYYQYIGLFSHIFSYLITENLMLECLY